MLGIVFSLALWERVGVRGLNDYVAKHFFVFSNKISGKSLIHATALSLT